MRGRVLSGDDMQEGFLEKGDQTEGDFHCGWLVAKDPIIYSEKTC